MFQQVLQYSLCRADDPAGGLKVLDFCLVLLGVLVADSGAVVL
jgi:hypothetical protein